MKFRQWLNLIGAILSWCFIHSCGPVNLITTNITHATCSNPGSGSINQTINLLNLNALTVSHSWSNGASTEDINGVAPIYPQSYRDHIVISAGGTGIAFDQNYDVLYKAGWLQLNQLTNNSTSGVVSNSTNTTVGYGVSENVLPANGIGYFEFTVSQSAFTDDDFATIGFNSADLYNAMNDYGQFHGFAFNAGATYSNYFIKIGNRFYLPTGNDCTYRPGDRFKIKYSNNGIGYYKNDVLVFPGNIPVAFMAGHEAQNIKVEIAARRIIFSNIASTFGCFPETNFYAELNKELDATCHTMVNAVKFRYKEKYQDGTLSYVIYDWKRNKLVSSAGLGGGVILATEGSNVSGVNYHTIPINANLPEHETYVLEVTNAKGEIYKTRFLYKRSPVAAQFTATPTIDPDPIIDIINASSDYAD